MSRLRVLTFGTLSVLGLVVLIGISLHFILSTDPTLPTKTPTAIRIASYNVHYIINRPTANSWGLEHWEQRKEALSEIVAGLETDIIGFQEMETFSGSDVTETNLTLSWLQEMHPEFTAGAVGDPAVFPSTQPIFYRHDRFDKRDEGWFFFSNTPEEIYSRTFNGSYPAFASWLTLTDKNTNQIFRLVNIHTDFASWQNRKQSLRLVRERVAPWVAAGETVFIIGDFNAWRGSYLLSLISDAGFSFAPVTAATYHFNRGLHLFPAIDHIAFTSNVHLIATKVLQHTKNSSTWPTDHYPVVADVVIPK